MSLEEVTETFASRLKRKSKEYLVRYWKAELFGTGVALLYYPLSDPVLDLEEIRAWKTSVVETIAFYSFMYAQDTVYDSRKAKEKREAYGFRENLITMRNLGLEFGLSELADTFLTRPLGIKYGVEKLGERIGVLAGNTFANVIFYLQAVLSKETSRKYIPNQS